MLMLNSNIVICGCLHFFNNRDEDLIYIVFKGWIAKYKVSNLTT